MYESYTQQGTQLMTPVVSFPKTDHAPTIASSAILVELTIRTWAGRKKDKRATKEVNSQNNAATGTANVTKKLLGECEELKAITNYAEVIRDYHRSSTLPWSKGAELLTNDYFLDYNGICERIIQPLQLLVERIDFGAGDKAKKIYDTTVQHAHDLLDILKVCNVTKDPKIEAVRLDIARALEGVTTDGLRNSHHLRAKTKRNVEDIIKNLPSLGF